MKLSGIPAIDAQHKFLFDTIFRGRSLVKNNEFIALLEVLGRLEDYTHLHFRDEEKFMLENNISGFEEHKAEHENFKKIVHQHLEDLSRTGEPSMDILDFAEGWLISHINVEADLFRQHMNILITVGQ
jgi:hemerythrin